MGANAAAAKSLTSKAQIVAALKEHGDRFAKCLDSMSDADLGTLQEQVDEAVQQYVQERDIRAEELKERLLEAADTSYAERVERNTPPLMRMIEKQVVQIYAATQKDKTGTPWVRNVHVKEMTRYCAELVEFE